MTKEQAIQDFWSSFGLPAYDSQTVPQNAVMPYITYDVYTSRFEDVVTLSASIWYYSTSWKAISDKASEIARYIGTGFQVKKVDGGYMWITQGAPFAQRMSDPADEMIRRIYLITQAEFLTAY